MKRSEIILPAYFDRYINQTDDVTVEEALLISLQELQLLPVEEWKAIGNAVYAPGKWTIKDILQHLVDTERVFSYRALSFARGEKDVRSFDENNYASMANAGRRSLEELIEEAIGVRKATMLLFSSFDKDMLSKAGVGFKGEYTVHAIGFIIAGHQRWHWNIIKERYYSLHRA
ncbi:DinB family protein [Panacibacter sp. DH6]|uniref:DinB family protein n=1 Tax=Panacibacter microcysteis TaxID=2793269 RepID=A0A931GU78_9BACT|nr:DinB family protein [Panacibacter microcysteis]MBG9376376.1 DinB family protein [Panacibacter microcysteis]